MASERNAFGEYRRSTVEKPLTEKRQGRHDKGVARVMAQAATRLGPAYDANEVAIQRLFLVKSGLMPASVVFAPRPYRPGR